MTVRQAVKSAMALLSRRDRRLLKTSMAIQMATSLLDLVGILLIGLVGALAVTTVQSQPPPAIVLTVTGILGLGKLSSQTLVLVLSASAAVVLLTKSVASSYLTRRVLTFLANRQALVSARLSKELLARPLTFIQERSSQETAYALITGAGAATSQILGQLVIATSEVALLAVLGGALLLISPWAAIGAIVFFIAVAYVLQRAMGDWAARVGRIGAQADIASLNAVQEALGAYREITVLDRRALYVDRIQRLRWDAAKVAADRQFIGMFPKYMFEAALVLGGFALAAVLFATQDSIVAVGTLALFLAAGSRVMPSLLRLQGAALGLRGAAGSAAPTFELAEALDNPLSLPEQVPEIEVIKHRIHRGFPDFQPVVQLTDVTFTYSDATVPALQRVSLTAEPGQSVAVVGRSGAGKSTLADIILGLIEPDSGEALVGNLGALAAASTWPGGIAYVPQTVVLANDTVRANVALGIPDQAIEDHLVWDALARAHIDAFIREQPEGLSTVVGEGGLRFSGGQRQRLGIARALYTQPRLLVLDEATSALDAETEHAISAMIQGLGGTVTTIVIAHRLSTVRSVGKVVYLEDGRLVAQGSFMEVCDQVPALQRQAALMGLIDGTDTG